MRFFSLMIAVCLPGMVFSQQTDSLKTDSARSAPKSIVRLKRGLDAPKIKSFIVPGILIGYGLVSLANDHVRKLDFSTQAEIREDHPTFKNHADNYLQIAPMVAVYGLNLAGVKGKHNLADATALYILSSGFAISSTYGVKKWAKRVRPDGMDNESFPSGHTANAFAAAEFLNQEYRDVSPWIGYAGYTVATATGVFRLYNNKHWLSDVVAGAGFGIASTKLAYLIYPHLKKLVIGKQPVKYSLVPMYQQKAAGLSFNGTF